MTDRLVPDPIDGDNTALLNDAFAALRKGDRLIFPEGVDYVCEGTVVCGAKWDVVVDWNGSRLVAKTNGLADTTANRRANRNRAHLRQAGGINVTHNDYTVSGPKPEDEGFDANLEAQHGVLIQSGDGTFFNRPRIENVWGDGFYLSQNGAKRPPARAVYVTDPFVREVGRHGIAPILCEDVHFYGGEFYAMSNSFVDIELEGVGTTENPAACRRVTIEGKSASQRMIVQNYKNNLVSSMGAAAIVEDILLRFLDVRGKPINGQLAAVKMSDSIVYPKKRITVAGCISDYTLGAGWAIRATHIESMGAVYNEQSFDLSKSQPKQWPNACMVMLADPPEGEKPRVYWNNLPERSGREIPQVIVR